MAHSLLELAAQLTREGQPFVLATVVWRERPTSAKPGAQAIIQVDGRLTGWVGGNCTQPVVLREAKRLLREGGEPLLLRLGVSASGLERRATDGVRVFPMTCASGGALDIYLEPHLPRPQLLLIGDSPIVAALQQFAPTLEFAVSQVDEIALPQATIDEHTFIVVATHGQYDESVLIYALASPAAYIGMVSSPRRAAACRDYLRASGLVEEQIARLKAPAGLDIGAYTPQEIAVSIIAELVQLRRRLARSTASDEIVASDGAEGAASELQIGEAIDPVCGMTVEIASARHTATHAGSSFYFCCPACKREFEREPERFLSG